MTKLLETYLKIGFEEPNKSEMQRLVQRNVPRELSTEFDGRTEPVRELLLSTAIESTTLIQTEMYNTVMQGARMAQCFRQAVPVFQMKANSLTMPYGATSTYAGMVAEGAEVPISSQDYNVITFTAHKYAARPVITTEMIDDGLYDAIALEVEYAGESIENSLNQLALTEMLDGAGNEQDCDVSGTPTVADAGVKAIAAGMSLMKEDKMKPDTIVMSPGFEAVLLQEYLPSNYVGSDVAATGRVPSLLGLKPYMCDVADASSSYTWGYSSDGYIGAIILDTRKCGGIGMRQDIRITEYKDPIRDLQGAVLTARFDADSVLANAICRIEY